jgi:GNAT superfamily N-acetyltransferase
VTHVVQSLDRKQRRGVLRHLIGLPAEDLRLRFGRSKNARALKSYVRGIDFSVDKLFGVYDNQLRLVGFAHLALDREKGFAELGLSVLPDSRKQGYGEALLRRAALHASNLGLRVLYMHCLRENEPMMRLAHKAGFNVVAEGTEADAKRPVSPASFESIGQEMLFDQIALTDYVFKQHANMLRRASNLRGFFYG